MGKPAARLGDMHTCPQVTLLVPHVGGPILPPGVPTVLIGGQPAATMGNQCLCVSPAPDIIQQGSATVKIGGQGAARLGDATAHGGMISAGFATVLIGD
ncbi:MAG: PAAR domain-containing protein [Lewinellaceae bacterium]|nr:PAAR domain-containing protein [Saprospiraceae bacterium]MCB9333146.1 PAAR domain-containing protein [Lewinellaceae bacterium]